MALLTNINPFSKANNDTGFGSNASSYGGRFINKDGSYNITREGVPFLKRFSIYHTMLNMPRWKFIAVIVVFFLVINLCYTGIYFLAGIDGLQGLIATTPWQKFKEVYFFSTETFTTVGYGRVNPLGDAINLVAAIEAMSGFLSFAIATGLIYGRFAKPKSHLVFSDIAVVAPFQDKTAFMFRFAAYKDYHILTNVEIKVNIGLLVEEDGKLGYKFYDLTLERSRVDSLMMNWTVVHPIDDNSPLLNLTWDDMKANDIEVYVMVRGFDDIYANTVLQRTSYVYDEIMFDKKFIPMYHESEDGMTTILELDKLNEYKDAPITQQQVFIPQEQVTEDQKGAMKFYP